MGRLSSIPILLAATIYIFLGTCEAQRVAPGVPPPNYQQYQAAPSHQAPPPQQNQYQPSAPPPQQHQQQNYGQPTPPPVQQPPAPQQVHPGSQTYAERGEAHRRPLDASSVVEDRDHIAEHMPVPIDTSKMTEQELQFHYFKMHDSDGNHLLDGCEMMKSLTHAHDDHANPPADGAPPFVYKDEDISGIIDPVLAANDKNNDGYIDWGEFVQLQSGVAQRSGN